MKKLRILVALVLMAGFGALPAHAVNVALGKNVTLNGVFFDDAGGWGGSVTSAASRIVNGTFAPETTQWNTDGVWWNGKYSGNNIVIDLGGTYSIASFVVQADDNDMYRVSYLGTDSNWHTAYDAGTIPSWGLVTRPEFVLSTPILASELKLEAIAGDNLYSVSQLVANGRATVPIPATLLLFGPGLAGLALIKRRFMK